MTAIIHIMKSRNTDITDTDTIDWNTIVQKIANDRDQSAFSVFFDHFAPKIKAFSHAKQPGADLVADDLVQEVMIKVWNKCHTYKPELASVSTWLFTMTRNCRIDQIRKAKAHIQLTVDDLWYEDDSEPDPFGAVQQHRVDENIHSSLNELPAEQKQVLTKVYLQGKTQQQTANELNLPLGTVKSRVRLALKKLENIVRSV
ncbi:MAG: sigma-70 family RNA polymerase sigma factor [Cellvibrionaceae bacterium]